MTPPSYQPLLHEIERQLAWPPAPEWTAAHFDRLAEEVARATDIRLSPTTLKRVWGHVAYASQPSRTTLDALARFAGYADWVSAEAALHADRASGPAEPASPPAPVPSVTGSPAANPRPAHGRRWSPALIGLAAAALLVVLVSALARRFAEPYAGPPPVATRFDFAPITDEPPTTVQFRYGVAGAYDSLAIQQSWDERLRQRIDPTRDFFACTYYLPDAYRAKLVADDSVLAQRPLVIPSGGWLGTRGGGEGEPPEYVRQAELRSPGGGYRIAGSPAAGERMGAAAEIHFVGEAAMAPRADSVELRTRFRNLGADACRRSSLIVFGEAGTIILQFALPGCTGEVYVYACGQSWLGSDLDLSGFGVGPGEEAEVTLQLRDSTLAVEVDGQSAFRQNLPRSPGRIVGARWSFKEAGEVLAYGVE